MDLEHRAGAKKVVFALGRAGMSRRVAGFLFILI